MKTTQRHGFDIFETMLSYNDNEVGTVSWDDDRRKKKGNRKYAMRIMTHPLPWHRPEHEKRISARNCNLCLEMKTRIHSSSHLNLGHILFCVGKGTYSRSLGSSSQDIWWDCEFLRRSHNGAVVGLSLAQTAAKAVIARRTSVRIWYSRRFSIFLRKSFYLVQSHIPYLDILLDILDILMISMNNNVLYQLIYIDLRTIEYGFLDSISWIWHCRIILGS